MIPALRTLRDDAFLSTSTNPGVADDFLKGNAPRPHEEPVIMRVEGHSGSNTAPFSAVPDVREVVLLPATVFALAGSRAIETLLVHLVVELDHATLDVPVPTGELDSVARSAGRRLAAVREAGPATIRTPGKFVGDIV